MRCHCNAYINVTLCSLTSLGRFLRFGAFRAFGRNDRSTFAQYNAAGAPKGAPAAFIIPQRLYVFYMPKNSTPLSITSFTKSLTRE